MKKDEIFAIKMQLNNILGNMNTIEQNVPKGDWKDDVYVEASANHFKDVKAIKECIFNALAYIQNEAKPEIQQAV